MQSHSEREKENPVTSGESRGKSGYMRGEQREILLHAGREKGKAVKSGERK